MSEILPEFFIMSLNRTGTICRRKYRTLMTRISLQESRDISELKMLSGAIQMIRQQDILPFIWIIIIDMYNILDFSDPIGDRVSV